MLNPFFTREFRYSNAEKMNEYQFIQAVLSYFLNVSKEAKHDDALNIVFRIAIMTIMSFLALITWQHFFKKKAPRSTRTYVYEFEEAANSRECRVLSSTLSNSTVGAVLSVRIFIELVFYTLTLFVCLFAV